MPLSGSSLARANRAWLSRCLVEAPRKTRKQQRLGGFHRRFHHIAVPLRLFEKEFGLFVQKIANRLDSRLIHHVTPLASEKELLAGLHGTERLFPWSSNSAKSTNPATPSAHAAFHRCRTRSIVPSLRATGRHTTASSRHLDQLVRLDCKPCTESSKSDQSCKVKSLARGKRILAILAFQ